MEKRLIDANALLEHIKDVPTWCMYTGGWMPKKYPAGMYDPEDVVSSIENAPTVDAVEVVRCQDCVYSQPFDRNCKLNTSAYMHCSLQRGEEIKNVWHKYKKYYKDYSVVDRDGFCDQGERREG